MAGLGFVLAFLHASWLTYWFWSQEGHHLGKCAFLLKMTDIKQLQCLKSQPFQFCFLDLVSGLPISAIKI